MHSSLQQKPSLRINPHNPDHHLYLNNGTWWIHYTVHAGNYTAQRIRRSLETGDRQTARARRDAWLKHLHQRAS